MKELMMSGGHSSVPYESEELLLWDIAVVERGQKAIENSSRYCSKHEKYIPLDNTCSND
jgi:hypothetical protein